jgi:hypothetical protein
MRRLLLALVVAFAGSVPASACIWDSELPGHEREFRSSYEKSAPSTESESARQYLPWAAGGIGVALLVVGWVAVARQYGRGGGDAA